MPTVLRRLFVRVLLPLLGVAVVALLLAALVGPLLIDPAPAPGAANPATVAEPPSRFIEVVVGGDAPLAFHYLAAGAGPRAADGRAFVLLHGFTFNAFTWHRLLPVFAEFGPALAYDQLPYGLSAKPLPGDWADAGAGAGIGAGDPAPPHPYSKAAALAHLFALLDAFGIERAVLVGNSSGGTLALEAAIAQPARVEGLILLGPWVHAKRPLLPGWLAGLPQMQRLSLLIARQLGTDSPLLDYSYAHPERIDAARRELTGIHRRVAAWDLAWGALLQHSLTDPVTIAERLAEVRQPVLVITGAADQVVPIDDTSATAAALPNAELVVLPDCGHLPQEECPADTAAAIRGWLAAHDLAGSGAPAAGLAGDPARGRR